MLNVSSPMPNGVLLLLIYCCVLLPTSPGAIYFPLSSVKVTVPRVVPAGAPLLRLAVLSDDGIQLHNVSFHLAHAFQDGLFYIQQDQLKIHQTFISRNFSLENEVYSVVVWGETAGQEANMTCEVVLTRGSVNCEPDNPELCFWAESQYQVSENHEATPLGTLTSPIFSVLCSQFSVSYNLMEGDNMDVGSRASEWLLETTDMLDREMGEHVTAYVNCTVTDGGRRSSVTYHRELKVEVTDTDDNQPVLEFTTVPLPSNHVSKGQVLATGSITDLDLTGTITREVESDQDLNISCNGTTTATGHTSFNCDVISSEDFDIFKRIVMTVVAVDEDLSVGFGPKKTTIELSVGSGEPVERVPVNDRITYRSTRTTIPRGSQEGARVFTPERVTSGQPALFTLVAPSAFAITREDGVIYVKTPADLHIGSNKLKVAWAQNGVKSMQTLHATVVENGPQSACNVTARSNQNPVAMCSSLPNREVCTRTCGQGLSKPSREGGCHWVAVTAEGQFRYSTCSPNRKTCPDQHCDHLEKQYPLLCPQDCFRYHTYSGKEPITGISKAIGTCTCYVDDRQSRPLPPYCDCGEEYVDSDRQYTEDEYDENYHDQVTDELGPVCDDNCQIALSTSSVFIVIVIVGLLYYLYKYRRLEKRCLEAEELDNVNYGHRALQYTDNKWEFPRHRLTIEETIGEGEFGMVLKAKADGIRGQQGIVTVAVKTLKTEAKQSDVTDLMSEYELLKDVHHQNVITLLGACTTPDGPIYVIIEYAHHGSLRSYLRKHRTTDKQVEKEAVYLEGVTDLSPKQILTFAWQVAKGMSYLAEMKLVHRDLAARNVLVTADLVCKISDFGLTRDIYEDDTYLKRSKGRVPIKWMALESLADHVYTTKSDVWSYGVVLWELATCASTPYPGISGQQLYSLLQGGYRMDRPAACSPELYQVMKCCWAANPAHRPSFNSLVMSLDGMLAAGRDYLELNPRAVDNLQYLQDESDGGGLFWRFQGYDEPRVLCSCCPQSAQLCLFHGKQRYENDNVQDADLLHFNSNNLHNKGDLASINKV